MCNGLNRISNVMCQTPLLNGLNPDTDSSFVSYQMFPLRVSLSVCGKVA